MTAVPIVQMPQTKKFVIKDIKYFHDKMGARQFYVTFTVKQTTIKTTTSHKRDMLSPTWADSLSFDALDSSRLKIAVYARNLIGGETLAGELEDTIESLMSSATVDLQLKKPDSSGILQPRDRRIMFKISEDHPSLAGINVVPAPLSTEPLASVIATTKDAVQRLDHVPWESLLRNADQFSMWKGLLRILFGAHKIMLNQISRDDGIEGLVQVLDEVYSFLHEAKALEKIKAALTSDAQLTVLVLISQQLRESAYFIQEYARDPRFWTRLVKNLGSEANSTIQAYRNKFSELKLAFQGYAHLQTEITVFQILGQVNNLVIKADLQDMLYSRGATFNPEKGCLPKTRLAIIDEIVEWATSSADSHKVYWLYGVAGSGKSAIAHSVAKRLSDQKRLGSFYSFDATNQVDRTPQYLFSTISRDLADFSSEWETALWNVIKDNTSLRSDPSVDPFRKLQNSDYISA
ncbi:hypothetical protein Hypma_009409 [Hypsizygus marmoreus]|uniref:C2 domain-containing protein n=1 Tax=Hypsizygus marmoreus TaxID=39966 RepID=A0A369JTN3_HYPMA|nr:hypothetical protein Hypma_009409 [Hypsizygus marmoreus]